MKIDSDSDNADDDDHDGERDDDRYGSVSLINDTNHDHVR